MYLRFIGADGSMGLRHGDTYDVKINVKNNYIWVIIPKFEFRYKVWGTWKCPYSSPQSLAANWDIKSKNSSLNNNKSQEVNKMFEEVRKCLDKFEKFLTECNRTSDPSEEEYDFYRYFELYLAKAIMSDFNDCNAEKIAKIILATLGLSNEIKVKVD